MQFDIKKHTILFTIAGSRAYGMSTPTSDVDVKGVAIAPKEYYFGILNNFEQADKKDHIMKFYNYLTAEEKVKADEGEFEGSIYDIRKFFKLASGANPNILDVLFCRDKDVRFQTKLGKKIRNNRDLFLSKKAKFTFSGYAISQLKRIKTHRQWLLNPYSSPPTRAEYGLTDKKLIPMDQIQAAQNAIQKKFDDWEVDYGDMDEAGKIYIQDQIQKFLLDMKLGAEDKFEIAAKAVGCSDNFIEIMKREKQYRIHKQQWKQYLEWKKNRNPERAALEAKYGMDCKHAVHLVRLFKVCRELFETGTVNVYRDDTEELLAIRNGAWSYEQIIEFAEKEDKDLDELYKTSSLPHSPDRVKLNKLCVEIIEEYYAM